MFKKILRRLESQRMRLSPWPGGSAGYKCVSEEDVAGGGIMHVSVAGRSQPRAHAHMVIFVCQQVDLSGWVYGYRCTGVCARRATVVALGWAGSLGLAGHQPPAGSR